THRRARILRATPHLSDEPGGGPSERDDSRHAAGTRTHACHDGGGAFRLAFGRLEKNRCPAGGTDADVEPRGLSATRRRTKPALAAPTRGDARFGSGGTGPG